MKNKLLHTMREEQLFKDNCKKNNCIDLYHKWHEHILKHLPENDFVSTLNSETEDVKIFKKLLNEYYSRLKIIH